jgi:amino acid transporter
MYLVSSLILGLIVPNGSPELLGASGANTRASPFVLAIKYAGVKGLPSVFNVVICLSVLSVANSCTYGSTRLLQALAADGMAPKFLAYVDKAGRPIWPVIIQILFGFLAFANLAATGTTVLSWLLAVSGLTCFVSEDEMS